jgi:hypothetical protein
MGKDFTKVDYFYAMYLPILLAVLLKFVWVIVFASTKMVEPFHQLAKPKGATAEDTLFADYLSTGLSLSSAKALFQGHWVMALTTTIYVMLAFVIALAAESMSVKFLGTCATEKVAKFTCDPAWTVNISVIRGIEAILILMVIMIIILVILQSKRLNGVFSDPSGIASMASLLHHPEVLADFQVLDPMVSSSELHRLLAGNQYMLGTYEISPGQYRYGLIKTVGTVKLQNSQYHAISNPGNDDRPISTSFPWRAICDGTLGICLLALLGLCLGYYLDGQTDPFNNFFNSDTFGPRFILVIIATIVDYQWKRIEREVRIMYPFRLLSKRMATPQKTILPSRSGNPFSALPIALWNFNFFGAAIALVAILSDFLIIIIAGVPYNSGEIYLAALASFYISFGIIGLMLLALIALFMWRRSDPTMPREPDTLASVWTYLCASEMLGDMEGMEYMDEKRRDRSIRVGGRRYFYGISTGTDGRDRYMVDHERVGGPVVYYE